MRRTLYALAMAAGLCAPALALTPRDLTPDEQQLYQKVQANPNAAKNFLAAREYVRKAKGVVDGAVPAASLPSKPAGFSSRYLLAGDADIIDQAVTLSVAAMAQSLWA